MKRFVSATILVASVTIAGCSSDIPTTSEPQSALTSIRRTAALSADEASAAILEMGNAVNAGLAAQGAEFALAKAEWIGEDAEGNTVLFSDRGNKRLGEDFVAGDPRRAGRTNITYIIDQVDGNTNDGLTAVQTSDAIQRAMNTWNSVNCSAPIPIQRLPNAPFDLGVVEFFLGWGGGLPFSLADITHAGWIAPGRLPPNVIAVTFTFIFIAGPGGPPTDIDNNGRADVAFREIYYNDQFVWRINANIDVETVALHEAGHGLSQGHFGKGMIKNDGTLQLSPAAVMNAAYTGVRQELLGTDNAGHCANWASWPNN